MSEVLQANIFFFITGIAVVVFTVLVCVVLFHVIKLVKSLRRIFGRIEAGTEIIAEDMQSVRAYFAEDGFVKRLMSTLIGTFRDDATIEQKAPKQEKRKNLLKIKGDE